VRGYLAVAFGEESAARPLTGPSRPATLPAARVCRRVRWRGSPRPESVRRVRLPADSLAARRSLRPVGGL